LLVGAVKKRGWTIDTLKVHFDALRAADQRALSIKETADLRALELVSENQAYKEEKANKLREQIGEERGRYPTKDDLAAVVRELNAVVGPLTAYVASQQGQSKGIGMTTGTILAVIGALSGIAGVASVIIVLLR
jgi:hypothetical protein